MTVSGRPGSRSFLVPMVALASTLVGLVVAIVVVLVLRNGADGGPDGTGASPPTGSGPSTGSSTATVAAGPGGADCLVGTWRVTTHTEQVDVPGVGRLSFTGGAGSGLALGAGGTGIADYGTGTVYRSDYAGQDVVLELRGTVSYRYVLAGDRIELRDVRSDADVRLRVGDGTPGPWQDFTASTEPSSYACAGNSLTQKSLVYTTSYVRSG
ncbi:hypothetical protein I0C86_14130 [Plantactinospora sp. S1510]|uniref:Uncharacterized protein n=1 Tax=Plantactinospora alkalitolerans TaxID=2789879 RepID=A0ABS0GV23_9ACTN|nr:hypothetical protein [Plantactinospora alkalitolerans]MBF9130037.1 hypothetical protein [Plantactinospora alkalitolerans]MBF9130087.1 hypothetical protein [Plantactinospora alkalitolerans]